TWRPRTRTSWSRFATACSAWYAKVRTRRSPGEYQGAPGAARMDGGHAALPGHRGAAAPTGRAARGTRTGPQRRAAPHRLPGAGGRTGAVGGAVATARLRCDTPRRELGRTALRAPDRRRTRISLRYRIVT